MRIAIVDDDPESRRLLAGYLHKYEKESGEYFEISVFRDGKEIALNYKPIYDIILLDVQMAHLDGFSSAKFIRALDSEVILIFITNMSQYAIKGYEVDAMSYLLKPVPYFAFSQELKRSMERVLKRKNNYLILPVDDGFLRIDVREILFIESSKHRMTVHLKDIEYSLVGTMKEMESKLENADFFRCNSGYLVNLAQVMGVKNNCALVGSYQLQISRPKKKAFLAALTDYLGGAVQ